MQAPAHQRILEVDPRNLDGSVTVEYKRCVSEGAYAKVYRGKYLTLIVCVKALNHVSDDLVDPDSNLNRRFRREVKIWCDLNHSHVVKSYGWISFIRAEDEPSPSLVLSWCGGGNVKTFLRSRPNVDRRNLICGVLRGLAYLHRRYIVHGDVRQENVVVTDEGNAQLCDFGLSSILGDSSTNLLGSSVTPEPRYASPELVQGGSRDRRSDVWAFGCTSMGILSDKNPYHNKITEYGVIIAIESGGLPYDWDTEDHFQRAVGFCFQRNANDRPTIETIMEELEPDSSRVIISQCHREQLLAAVNQELEQLDKRNLGGHIELGPMMCARGRRTHRMHGDVYEGVYNEKTVRVKALRVISINVEVMLRFVLQFKEYMAKLCDLICPNLVDMHGWTLSVVGGKQLHAQLISRPCGDIETYLRQHPDAACRVVITSEPTQINYANNFLRSVRFATDYFIFMKTVLFTVISGRQMS